MPRSGKGSAFERAVAVRLSRWWTQDEKPSRSDVFWRTPTSGGRATSRAKRGERTANHYGDLLAADSVGQPFLDLFTVELKRGYNRVSVADLLDKPARAKKQVWEGWFDKLAVTASNAGSWSWLLIARRDRREPLAFLPLDKASNLLGGRCPPCLLPRFTVHRDGGEEAILGVILGGVLEAVSPADVRNLAAEWRAYRDEGSNRDAG